MRVRIVVLGALAITVIGAAIYFINNPTGLSVAEADSAISHSTSDINTQRNNFGDVALNAPLESAVANVPWYVVIAGATIAAFALSWITYFFTSRRRRDLLRSPHLVTPENFSKWTGSVSGSLENVVNALITLSEHTKIAQEAHRQSVGELSETFLTLNKAIEQRDQQIRKAEQGWERHVFKKFLVRFARVDQTLNDDLLEPAEVLRQARALMNDALNECDVHPLIPPIGSDYRKINGVDDSPLLVPTNDPSLFYLIKRVITPGYRLSAPDQDDVIVIPAKVEVYSPSENLDA